MKTTPTPRPELKQFAKLVPADFVRHAVWVSCHSVDYDEDWYDDTDEETFRPWTGTIPVGSDEMYLVRSSYTLKDGTRMTGFATPASAKNNWGAMQPQIFLSNGQFGSVWYGMFPPEKAVLMFCEGLGRNKDDVFPIKFAADSGLTSEFCSGDILGLMKSGKTSFEILKE